MAVTRVLRKSNRSKGTRPASWVPFSVIHQAGLNSEVRAQGEGGIQASVEAGLHFAGHGAIGQFGHIKHALHRVTRPIGDIDACPDPKMYTLAGSSNRSSGGILLRPGRQRSIVGLPSLSRQFAPSLFLESRLKQLINNGESRVIGGEGLHQKLARQHKLIMSLGGIFLIEVQVAQV